MSNVGSNLLRGLRIFFGIFMICIYFGMSVLMVINFFDWSHSWAWMRWSLAVIFAVYGVWRCYRQIKGYDYYMGTTYGQEIKEDSNKNEEVK
jgi:hypothetical protein